MNPTRAKLSAGSVGFVPLGLPGRKTSAVLGDHRNSESFGIAQPHPGSTISTPKPKPCPQGAHPDTSGHFQRYFPAQPIPVTRLALGAGFGICHGQGLLLPRSLRRNTGWDRCLLLTFPKNWQNRGEAAGRARAALKLAWVNGSKGRGKIPVGTSPSLRSLG